MAVAGVGGQHHGSKDLRNGCRGGDSAGDRMRIEVAAGRREGGIVKEERRAIIDARSVDHDVGAMAGAEFGKRRAMKQIVVEPAQKLLRVVDAAFIGADDADRDERSSERLLRIAQ